MSSITSVLDPSPVRPAIPVLLPVLGAEAEVPLVTGGSARYANLDYAASAPALVSVADRVTELLPYYSSVHRGAGYASQVCTELYERARVSVAGFVGACADDVTIFTRNTTDSLNLLARAVPGEVVHLDIEHHANLLPWQRRGRRVVAAGGTVEETVIAIETELARRPAALLTVTAASNVTGERLPLRLLADLAHIHGARIAVDAAQLVAHHRVDIDRLGLDYVAFSGHKTYAPFGAGVLVGRRDWLDAAPAHLAGGGAVVEVGLARTDWARSPARHEGGTPNVVGAVALAAAVEALGALPPSALTVHTALLRERLVTGLARLGISPLGIWSDSDLPVGLVSFTVPGFDADHVAIYLSAEHGIGVRDGRFCAHPLLERLGCPSGAVRASFGAGNSSDDVDRLLVALRALLDRGPAWSYGRVDGRWRPTPETRALPVHFGAEPLRPASESPCTSEEASA